MRFAPAPNSVCDEQGLPLFGAYEGNIPYIDLEILLGTGLRGIARKLTQRKRWQYHFFSTDEVMGALAMVDLGYAANAFIFIADRHGDLRFSKSFMGAPGLSILISPLPGDGSQASFQIPGVRMDARRINQRLRLSATIKQLLSLEAYFDRVNAGPDLTLVAPIVGNKVNVTQKSTAWQLSGELIVEGRRYRLDGGTAGMDYTHGLLARETAWRWAFSSGTVNNQPFGFNLVEGFNEGVGREDSLWYGNRLYPLPACHFQFSKQAPETPWTITSEDKSVNLRFEAIGSHREHRNLGVARSWFVQVFGTFSGTIRLPDGEILTFENVAGVTEDQDVRW